MSSLYFSVALARGESCNFVSGSRICTQRDKDLLLTGPFTGLHGARLKHPERSGAGGRHRGYIVARIKKGRKNVRPWPKEIDPNIKGGHLSYLSSFKPLAEKPKQFTLAFEKDLADVDNKIIDVRKMADETGLDFSDQIRFLENKRHQALKNLYTNLEPIQRLQIARHPNRPTFLDHILNMTDKWVELHGDRAGYDDPAIVTGIGSMDGKSYLFIGHQKGRNTKENIQRNFGMPTPHGYRKALRMMRYANHHGFPIITLIDTPGAFADLKCEELGQGEAIAFNLREMFSLKVPIVSVVLGEGGSGGALAIGCANTLLMLENAVFYVASPEACAAILWKSSQATPKAAKKLKITAAELCRLHIADGIIPEPLGGAHRDPAWTSQQIKEAVTKAVAELEKWDTETLLNLRHLKFRNMGGFTEGAFVEPEMKRKMKQKEADALNVIAEIAVELDNMKKSRDAMGKVPSPNISPEAIKKLKEAVDKETSDAFISMGLQGKLESLKKEISKSSRPDQPLSPILQNKVDMLAQEFSQELSRPGPYRGLKQKLEMLNEVSKLMECGKKNNKLKKEINVKLPVQVKEKMKVLRRIRDKMATGELLSKEELEEAVLAKEEMKGEMAETLKSANLEVVGLGRKKVSSAPPNFEAQIAKVGKVLGRVRMRGKIDKLKDAIKSNSRKERVKLQKQIRKGIAAVFNAEKLKVENLNQERAVEASASEASAGEKDVRLVQELK